MRMLLSPNFLLNKIAFKKNLFFIVIIVINIQSEIIITTIIIGAVYEDNHSIDLLNCCSDTVVMKLNV